MTLLDETASIEAPFIETKNGTDLPAPDTFVDLTKPPVDFDPAQSQEAQQNYLLSDQVRKWTGRALLGTLMFSGVTAAAEFSVFHGPPAHIKTDILANPDSPGGGTLNLEIKPKIGDSLES